MILLAQRTEGATLDIVADGVRTHVGRIAAGLVVYVGFEKIDADIDYAKYAEKMLNLRIFEDDAGKMNRSLRDISAGIMIIPNFTLAADASKGNRPSFDDAMPPIEARLCFESFYNAVNTAHSMVVCGIFGADMRITQHNNGPINMILRV
jgi:D-tyrosyl-tRNA(Tyr) deacylase